MEKEAHFILACHNEIVKEQFMQLAPRPFDVKLSAKKMDEFIRKHGKHVKKKILVNQQNNTSQSVSAKVPKCQNDALECTLEELIILKHIAEEPCVKQNDLAKITGKSLSTVKH